MKLNQDKVYAQSSFFGIPTYYDIEHDIYFCLPESRIFIDKFYQGDYWDDFSRKSKKNILGKNIEKILDFFNIPDTGNYKNINILKQKGFLTKKSSILEIGSGKGNNIIYLSKKGYNIQGIEMDNKNIEYIQSKIGIDSIIQGNYEDIDLKLKYDIIYLRHVLEHFYDLDSVINKLKNNLTNDGFIFIDVPHCNNQKTLDRSIHKHPHIYHFTKKSLKNIFKENDLNCVYMDTHQRLKTQISRFQILNSLYRIYIRVFNIPAISKKINDTTNTEPHDLVAIFQNNKSI